MLVNKMYTIIQLFFIITLIANNELLLHSYKEDITGDHTKEYIRLLGEPFDENSNYFHRVLLSIDSMNEHKWQIPLADGYNPRLIIVDLNNDNINDLFYQVANASNNNQVKQQLYTVSNQQLKPLPLPEIAPMRVKLLENYKISLSTGNHDLSYIFDVKNLHPSFKRKYEQTWQKGGPSSLRIRENLSLEPVWLPHVGGYGLRNSQQIEDSINKNIIGEIQTTWYFKHNKWIVLNRELLEKIPF